MKEDAMRASLLLAAFALFTLVACDTDTVTGSGNITSEVRVTSPFQNIDIAGTSNVVITPGSKYSVRVETDDNMQKAISATASNHSLKIRQDNGYTRATVYITTPVLSSITTQTTGELTIASGFTTESFLLTSGSAGNIAIHNLTANSATVQSNGSASITMSGSTNTFNCQHRGQGTIHAFDFVSSEAAVAVFNSGSVELTVNNKLFADILGSGNIVYKGNPEIVTSRKGSGTVSQKQ